MATLAFERETERPATHLTDSPADGRHERRPGHGSGGPVGGPRQEARRLLRRVTIKQRLWAMAVMAIVVFLVMTVIGVLRVGPLISQNNTSAVTNQSIAAMNRAHNAWIASDDMVESALNAARIESQSPGITQTTVNYAATYYQDTLKAIDQAVGPIKDDPAGAAAVKAFEAIRKQIVDYHDTIQTKAISLMQAGDQVGAARVAIIKAYAPYLAIDKAFTALTKGADAASTGDIKSSNDALSSLRLSLAIVAIIGAVLFIGVALLIIRSISRPLQRVVDALRAIAGGDRTKRVDHLNHDEIGSIATSIDQVIASLDAADEAAATARAEREVGRVLREVQPGQRADRAHPHVPVLVAERDRAAAEGRAHAGGRHVGDRNFRNEDRQIA